MILMGRKGTPVDWSQFNAAAEAKIGRIPTRGERLALHELRALGFDEAARSPELARLLAERNRT